MLRKHAGPGLAEIVVVCLGVLMLAACGATLTATATPTPTAIPATPGEEILQVSRTATGSIALL